MEKFKADVAAVFARVKNVGAIFQREPFGDLAKAAEQYVDGIEARLAALEAATGVTPPPAQDKPAA